MNDEDVKKLQNLIDLLGDTMENAFEKLGIKNETDMSEAIMLDVLKFLMFLAASDNEVTWDETDLISRISCIRWTPGLLGKFIRENDIYSVRFERQVPATFGMLVNTEKILMSLGGKTNLSAQILNIYKLIGEAFLSLSPENKNAISNYRSYIGMMEEYLAENLLTSNESSRGFVKRGAEEENEGTDDKHKPAVTEEDDDVGVEAPKKG